MSGEADIKKITEIYHITFPVGKDTGIIKRFNIRGLPVTIFVAKDGRVVKKHFGEIDYDQLVLNIEALLKL